MKEYGVFCPLKEGGTSQDLSNALNVAHRQDRWRPICSVHNGEWIIMEREWSDVSRETLPAAEQTQQLAACPQLRLGDGSTLTTGGFATHPSTYWPHNDGGVTRVEIGDIPIRIEDVMPSAQPTVASGMAFHRLPGETADKVPDRYKSWMTDTQWRQACEGKYIAING